MVVKYTLSLAMYIKNVGGIVKNSLFKFSSQEVSIIKVFLKNFAKLAEAIYAGVSFSIKLKVVG